MTQYYGHILSVYDRLFLESILLLLLILVNVNLPVILSLFTAVFRSSVTRWRSGFRLRPRLRPYRYPRDSIFRPNSASVPICFSSLVASLAFGPLCLHFTLRKQAGRSLILVHFPRHYYYYSWWNTYFLFFRILKPKLSDYQYSTVNTLQWRCLGYRNYPTYSWPRSGSTLLRVCGHFTSFFLSHRRRVNRVFACLHG